MRKLIFIILVAQLVLSQRIVPDFHIEVPESKPLEKIDLPKEVDWQNMNGTNYLTLIRQQHIPQYCGSCWAQAASSSISDRIKIMRNASWPDIQIAPQVIISCVDTCQGCFGGLAILAYSFMTKNNITDESCTPYQARGNTNGIECSPMIKCKTCWGFNQTCSVPDRYPVYAADTYGKVNGTEDMMQEIAQRGPIACGIVSGPLENYTGGIVTDPTKYNVSDTDHSVSIVGYGEENNVPYWLVRNSWGTHFGEEGFFRVYRGNNTLALETDCSWVVPKDTWTDQWYHYTTEDERNDPRNEETIKSLTENTEEKQPKACTYKCQNIPENLKTPKPHTYIKPEDVPKNFDWRNISGVNYLSWTKNQHIPQYCGSCWAQAPTSCIADRINIINKMQGKNLALSPQAVINCGTAGSCHGGDPAAVYKFAQETGVPHDSCTNYQAMDPTDANCSAILTCKDCSWPPPAVNETGYENCHAVEHKSYKIAEYGDTHGNTEMKAEILARGPISCLIESTQKFEEYTGGIYHEHLDWAPMLNHVIGVVGWGVSENGTAYWIGRNSWGNYWGEQGFFRILQGYMNDNLGIEEQCGFGVPSQEEEIMF